jgi:hypothetical protein
MRGEEANEMLSTSIAVVLERLGDDESRLRDLDDDVSGRDLREYMLRKLRRFLCMRFYQTQKILQLSDRPAGLQVKCVQLLVEWKKINRPSPSFFRGVGLQI